MMNLFRSLALSAMMFTPLILAAEDKPSKKGPSKEDASVFSYVTGYKGGKRLAQSPQLKGKDHALFIKGVRASAAGEQGTEEDQKRPEFKMGLKVGKELATVGKKQFPYADNDSLITGLEDGITGKKSAYDQQRTTQAFKACNRYVIQPKRKVGPHPLLKKPAPKWEVGEWHQLPEGTTELDISDFKGKVLYMYCFQSWCPGCHSHGFPTLKKLVDKYKDDDKVAFVAIQTVFEDRDDKPVNTFENLKKIAKKYKLDSIPFAQSGSSENRSKIMAAYKTRGTPYTIIVDPEGKIQYGDFRITVYQAAKLIDSLKEKE